MKTFLFTLLLFQLTHISAQKWHIGIEIKNVDTKTGGETLFPYLESYGITRYHTQLKSISPGLYFQHNIKKTLSIAYKLHYLKKGSDLYLSKVYFTNEVGNIIAQYDWYHKYRFNFISFTGLIKANYGSPVNIFVGAGPVYDFLVKATDEMDTLNHTSLIVENIIIDRKKDYNKITLGFLGEFGIRYIFGNNFSLSAGYNFYWRLSDFRINEYKNENINFNGYFFRAEYLFGNKKE